MNVASSMNGSEMDGIAYVYDALGRPVHRNSDSFGYNDRSEVANAIVSGTVSAYGYDGIGNSSLFAANSLNQYSQFQYDLDGNLLADDNQVFTYDSANRLKTVSSNGVLLVTNFYDAKSRRVKKVTPKETTTFIYDDWNLIEERVAYTDGTTSMTKYYWGKDLSGTLQGAGGVGGLLYLTVDGIVYIPCYDNNGNVTKYVDANGGVVASYTYDAFGKLIAKSGPLADFFRHRFSTKYFDAESNLYYYGYRFYHPALMRWLNRDPIEEDGGENLYGFCGNNPISQYDILGQSTCCRGGKKISCSNTYSWSGSVTTISVSRLFVGATFLMIDLTSNYICGSCTRYKLHAKAVLPTLSAGAPVSITGSNLKFDDVKPDAFTGGVLFSSVGVGAMGAIEASLLRLGSATTASLGIVGGAEFGASVSYGWYVDYDMKEE